MNLDVPDDDDPMTVILWRFALGDYGCLTEEQAYRLMWWVMADGERGEA